MSRFVQLHLLTSYPPANLNRDDLGRPKTAMMGGQPRLRVSSQSLKRAWRTSEVFADSLKGHVGTRTKEMGVEVFKALRDQGVAKKDALDWTKSIAEQFGKLKSLSAGEKKSLNDLEDDEKLKLELKEVEIEQLAHFSPEERQLIDELVTVLVERKSKPEKEELALLRNQHTAADIALFGRMLASKPLFNTEAAAQVAHAVSVHPVVVEDDFFTAVDDLNSGEDDAGAAHLGETEFAAGLFYLYLCIDKALLVKNLSDNEELANKTLAALIESAATVSPSGKQNSFASRARASYILCETGNQQPRSLSVAFLKPVSGADMLDSAIKQLGLTVKNMEEVYGKCADHRSSLNAVTAEGSLSAVIQCAAEA
ncbi:type I-E CRISPR-associated protein Cas7/Cse4/CasC [Leucothrix pacifica]|uniref:Type I-E CRISPR-associated protein Cas7/Cse4/CasC n=1 Tax=Leucothrix pacifica TaxID=1247513 RepID=A0A317CS27_9GAMM|nr:type I-E CRISPR-associated protein Cas7/Cse4/CasC [Leucothrix pacifica]PWR00344.1 type I-E CRISPR-associated protein Cas7/Cse4/CasC [Leucothrix pacifica]